MYNREKKELYQFHDILAAAKFFNKSSNMLLEESCKLQVDRNKYLRHYLIVIPL